MPTPTGNAPPASGPADLPDESALARLAAQMLAAFERAAPGFATDDATRLAPAFSPVASALPGMAGVLPAPAPAIVPDARKEASLPGGFGAATDVLLHTFVPASGAADAASHAASAYYFVTAVGAPAVPDAVPRGAEVPGRSAPQGVESAAHDNLLRVLADFAAPPVHGAVPAEPPAPTAWPTFYFLDAGRGTDDVPRIASTSPPFDVATIRRDFPILAERVGGKPLVWLDNAATTQKPQAVIDRLAHFYAHENSNIHRAAHELAARATDAYEGARKKVARFLGAGTPEEIVFVRGATEAVNLVAQTYGRQHLQPGDEIVLSHLEHHANIVPWQQIAAVTGARIRVIPVDDRGALLLDEYQQLLTARTRIVAVTHVSNALGTITPVRDIVDLAHRAGACVLIDGAQAVSHMRVDVQSLDADFYVFSGHKVFGPTGIGVVYGKAALLEAMPPYQGGGNMISDVTFEKTSYQPPPARFEAGTGNIADAVGLGAALDYLDRIGIENVARYEHDLLVYATAALAAVPGLRLIGTAPEKASVLSFVLADYTTEEVGQALSREGIAVRAGHHCAQPILRRFGLESTVRPSLAFYNTCEEIDALAAVLHRLADARRGPSARPGRRFA